MILYEDEYKRLNEICTRLLREAAASGVHLIDPNGQLVVSLGGYAQLDTTAFASLIAGSVAATSTLAQLLGEDDFPTHYHEGFREHLYIAKVAEGLILAVVFDERSSLGLVRLRVRKATKAIEAVYATMLAKAGHQKRVFDPFADTSDEEIERFFGENF